MSRQSRNPPRMSLEQALEEERREVLDILDGPRHSSSTSQKGNKNTSGTSYVRDFLEIPPNPLPSRRGSIAGSGVGITPTSRAHGVRRSIERVPSSPLRLTLSASSTPTSEDPPLASSSQDHFRGSPDDAELLNEMEQKGTKRQGVDFEKEYRFDMQPSIPNPDLRKAGQSRRSSKISGLEIRVLPNFARGRDSVRRSGSARGSSSGRGHSLSPVNRWLSSNPFSLGAKPGKIVTERGKVIDMDSAHRHLSDDALARSSGSLAALAKPGPDPASHGDGRLQKDLYDSEDNPLDSSGDEAEPDELSSYDDDATRRGIQKDEWENLPGTSSPKGDDDADPSKPPHQPQTLLEAAEEERKMVEEKNKSKSPVDPEPLKSALANAEKQSSKPSSVHPKTNYECSTSAANTPFGSDDEADMSDIKRAQQLSIQLSALDHSVRHRTVRSIVRGNFATAHEEAEEGYRRQRKYLVATDLSEESVYALEWTIGTILRDGDTMIAVFASHDEKEFGKDPESGGTRISSHDGGGSQVEEEGHLPRALFGRFGGAAGPDSKSGSGDSRHAAKKETERIRAVETLTQTCVRLLRKTLLQVRISVEVINCKSPKHIITEAIDRLVPTMVIVGARGQGALKGVLLGSFSNYLVNKSSVPVMVARKKLKAQPKQKKNKPRLSNNLTTPKKLSLAKVD